MVWCLRVGGRRKRCCSVIAIFFPCSDTQWCAKVDRKDSLGELGGSAESLGDAHSSRSQQLSTFIYDLLARPRPAIAAPKHIHLLPESVHRSHGRHPKHRAPLSPSSQQTCSQILFTKRYA